MGREAPAVAGGDVNRQDGEAKPWTESPALAFGACGDQGGSGGEEVGAVKKAVEQAAAVVDLIAGAGGGLGGERGVFEDLEVVLQVVEETLEPSHGERERRHAPLELGERRHEFRQECGHGWQGSARAGEIDG
jgi:hypothetical protein